MRRRFSEIAEIRAGYTFRERVEANEQGQIAVVQMKDIDEANQLHVETLVRVDLAALSSGYCLRPGDLLFRSRGSRYTAAPVMVVPDATIAAAPLVLIRPDVNIVEPSYLLWFINLPATQAMLTSFAAGTHTRTVGKAALAEIEVPMPPLSRQRQIVELDTLALRERSLAARIADARKRSMDRILWQCAQDTR